MGFIGEMQKILEKEEELTMELKTKKKIYGTLYAIQSEKELSKVPLGFNFDLMCKHAKSSTPNRKILLAAVDSIKYRAVPSYASPGLYKSDAPLRAIYDIIKAWKLKNVG